MTTTESGTEAGSDSGAATGAATGAPARPGRRAAPTDSYEAFFRDTWPRLYRTAYAVAGGDHGAAEDALQAAFARAFASWRTVRRADHPEAYVRRMVVNEVLDQRRRAWRRRERSEPEQPADDAVGLHGAAPTRDQTGDRVVERSTVWDAVLALPARQRAVVVLRYYEDLPEREIADILGCATGTVKSQASAALTTLRRLAADLTDGEPT